MPNTITLLREIDVRLYRLLTEYNSSIPALSGESPEERAQREQDENANRERVEEQLIALFEEAEDSADQYVSYIEQQLSLAEAANVEIKRLTELKYRRQAQADRVKTLLSKILYIVKKGVSFESELHEYNFNESITTEVVDPTRIPEAFLADPKPPVREPDKKRIKEYILSKLGKLKRKEIAKAIESEDPRLRKVRGVKLVVHRNLNIK